VYESDAPPQPPPLFPPQKNHLIEDFRIAPTSPCTHTFSSLANPFSLPLCISLLHAVVGVAVDKEF